MGVFPRSHCSFTVADDLAYRYMWQNMSHRLLRCQTVCVAPPGVFVVSIRAGFPLYAGRRDKRAHVYTVCMERGSGHPSAKGASGLRTLSPEAVVKQAFGTCLGKAAGSVLQRRLCALQNGVARWRYVRLCARGCAEYFSAGARRPPLVS